MQKTCAIIAIGALAVSVSQFAWAQTSSPEQSPRSADQSSALRDEVRATLEGAGFKNIRIMSESFLVHAIDPGGNPVVMVVHPDSQAILPEASEDQDEAIPSEPGYPDALSDLSEDAEEQATAPTPRGTRIGKSSKMTDRPPASEDQRPAQAGERAAKSAKMTDQDKNSGAAEQAEAHETPSQSAKMGDGAPGQTADNKKIPGRLNGMTTQMNAGEQGGLQLSTAQRTEIWKRLANQPATSAPSGFQPKVGATVPPSLQLKSLPNSVSSQVPQVQSYDYAMVQSQVLIVDPATKKIVSIITE
jgi:hypothetical protein